MYYRLNQFAKVDLYARMLCVRSHNRPTIYILTHFKQHRFKQPAKPLEPPTPRTSVLGLDRLAKEKRAASTSEDGGRKRQKLDSDKLFKSTESRDISLICPRSDTLAQVPALPGPRPGHSRQRGDETPSHPGGLSEAGRKKLEEYRRNRDRQRGDS